MLVLERKAGDRLYIRVPGRRLPIIVEYIGERSGRARIGIVAPRDVAVEREEIADELNANLEYQKRGAR